MNELVFKSDKGSPVTTSLLVAKKFEKNHKDVLKAIRNLDCSDEFHKRNFAPMFYTNEIGNGAVRNDPYTVMTRDGFTFLAMGFTGEKAGKFKEDYINAFNQMEQTIKNGSFSVPTTFREALLLAAEQQEVIESQQRLLSSQEPKVRFAEAITGADTNILMRDLAKIIYQSGNEIGEGRLYQWMVANKYLICRTRWSNKKQRYENDYTPTQKGAELKIFFVVESVITVGDSSFIKHTVKITPKGQQYFVNKFMQEKATAL